MNKDNIQNKQACTNDYTVYCILYCTSRQNTTNDKKAQLTQGFQYGRQPQSWILSNRK